MRARALLASAAITALSVTGTLVVPAAAQTPSDAPAWATSARFVDAWDAGLDGSGVGVVLIDSGVADHPDLTAISDRIDLVARAAGDGWGHGTVMAGVLAGDGTASAGEHVGGARGARIFSIKVADDDGVVTAARMKRAFLHAEQLGRRGVAQVVLLAGGVPASSDGTDPLEDAVESLTRHGMVVVVAAGSGELTSPATSPHALAVGAYDIGDPADPADDAAPAWSPRGLGDAGVERPDVLAPGVGIVSAADPSSALARHFRAAVVDGQYLRGSGTSHASAVVAAAAALVLQAHPSATPEQVRELFVSTARQVDGGLAIDVAAAVSAPLPDVASDAGRSPSPAVGDGIDGHGYSWAGFRWGGYSWNGYSWKGYSWKGYSWSSQG